MEQVHLSSTWKMTSLSAFTRNRGMSIQYGNGPFIDGESVKISFRFEFLPLGRMNADSDFCGGFRRRVSAVLHDKFKKFHPGIRHGNRGKPFINLTLFDAAPSG